MIRICEVDGIPMKQRFICKTHKVVLAFVNKLSRQRHLRKNESDKAKKGMAQSDPPSRWRHPMRADSAQHGSLPWSACERLKSEFQLDGLGL